MELMDISNQCLGGLFAIVLCVTWVKVSEKKLEMLKEVGCPADR